MGKAQDYFKLKQQNPQIAAKLHEALHVQRPIQRTVVSLAVADACQYIGWKQRNGVTS